MILPRLTFVLLLLLPTLSFGQTTQEDEDKVSNDNPARPLQMPPASTEVKEALDDFDRFQRRGAWERALKALYTIPEDQILRMVDGENGFIIPVQRQRRSALTALRPEGQAAYRLFYDAEAKKVFNEAEGGNELKNLERVFSAYFTTSIGDDAADRLGDLYFELGRFDRAADCWLAILRDRPDTDLSPALISVKAALALARAGRQLEFEQVRTELSSRFSDERLTLGGQTAAPAELLRRLLAQETLSGESAPREAADLPADPGLDLSRSVDPAWQMRFAESIEAGMTRLELTQWESNSLSNAVPAVTIDGSKLFVNFLGYILAIDLETGKMHWRTGAFHHLEVQAMQPAARMIDPARFAIEASGEYVWTLVRDIKDQNFMAPYHLICRRADNGEVIWKSVDLPDYAQFDLGGLPLLSNGKLFMAAKSQLNPQQGRNLPQQYVLAIQPHDGRLLWKTEVGTFRQGRPMFMYGNMRDSSPQARLISSGGAVYIDSHVGVMARLDSESGTLEWGYGYKTDSLRGQRHFFYYDFQEPQAASSTPLRMGEAFLIKGLQSERLYAVDPNRMKVLWDRPITKSARLLGVDDHAIYFGGDELSAVDLRTRQLLWATRLPGASLEGRVLVRREGLWQLTPRGIFEIDPKSGAVRRIFRGKDLGATWGDLTLSDRWLLAVSNRTISAYPRQASATQLSSRGDSATSNARASR
jgi:outer membrane protein assembly factor BamB